MPKPGPQLKLAQKLFNDLADAVQDADSVGAEKACGKILEKIEKDDLTVDSIQWLAEQTLRLAECAAQESHEHHVQSMIYQETARRMHSHFGFVMKKKNLPRIVGETWAAELVETSPKIDIDPKKLRAEATKFIVQIPMIDEKKLMEAIKAGEEIPGVTRSPQTVVNFVLQKKEQAT